MKLVVFNAKSYDKLYLTAARACELGVTTPIEIEHLSSPLNPETAGLLRVINDEAVNATPSILHNATAISIFVNDHLDKEVLAALAASGVRTVLLRCAGFNNVDLGAARKLGLSVARVPSYSPDAVAEFAVSLLTTLLRAVHRAWARVRDGNFALDQSVLGRTLKGKTVGVIGTGKIGTCAARILGTGFGCNVLGYDVFENPEFKALGSAANIKYAPSFDDLLEQSDFITLHCPLTDGTHHLINAAAFSKMKQGVLLINTSRGGLIDTHAALEALKSKKLGGMALDVYEGEGSIFGEDRSGDVVHDDLLMRLTTFSNVLVSGHQAFFTKEALVEIADTTIKNLVYLEEGKGEDECKGNVLVGKSRVEDGGQGGGDEESKLEGIIPIRV